MDITGYALRCVEFTYCQMGTVLFCGKDGFNIDASGFWNVIDWFTIDF